MLGLLALLVPLVWVAAPARVQAASEASVQVDVSSLAGSVAPELIGGNVNWNSADDLGDVSSDGHIYSNVTSVLANNQQLQLLRFPGGLLANCYDWTKGIGTQSSRPSTEPTYDFGTGKCKATGAPNHFGTDEFFNAGYQVNPAFGGMITVNVCSTATNQSSSACAVTSPNQGTELCPFPQLYPTAPGACPGADQAANWVRYLNGTDPANTWVQQREANNPGHPGPYGVRYFELGNEVFGEKTLSSSTYVNIAKAYRAAMRAADPTIMVGGVLDDSQSRTDNWDGTVATSGTFDFLIPHLYGGGIDARNPALRSAPAGTTLPTGYTRNQRYPFTTSTTGPYELDLYAFALGGNAQVTLTVDGDTAHSVTKTVAAGGDATSYQFTSWTASTTSHVLTVQYAPSATGGSSALYLAGGRVCSPLPSPPGCAASAAPNLDTTLAADDPNAIVALYPTLGSSFARTLVIPQGATQLQVQAYGTPTGTVGASLSCPSVTVTLDGQSLTTASLTNPTAGLGPACYTVFSPDVITVSLPQGTSAGPHSVGVAASGKKGTDADIAQVAALANGTVVATADLTPNPSGPQGFLQDVYATAAWQSSRLDRISQYHLPIIVSEWSATYGGPAATEPERENVESMVWDAALLQSMMRHGVAGSTFYSLDGSGSGGGFRIFHCLATAFEEWGGACAPTTLQPYFSVPGQMFSMLKQHFDASWVSPTVSAPPVTTSWIVDADWSLIASGGQSLSEVQALATRGTGVIDVQLINLADHAVSTQVSVVGTTPNGTATLTSLSGSPFTVDGCDQDAVHHPYNCNPSAVVPTSTQVTGAATMTVTLPSDSFSLLSVPTAT
jgi:hypothetical protein